MVGKKFWMIALIKGLLSSGTVTVMSLWLIYFAS